MSENETLESILKAVDEPRVEVFLDKDMREFLKFYAKNRDIYDIRSFGDKETKLLKGLLDDVLVSYILKFEHAGYKLSLYSKRVLDHKTEMKNRRKELLRPEKENEE